MSYIYNIRGTVRGVSYTTLVEADSPAEARRILGNYESNWENVEIYGRSEVLN